ncbi:MAG: GTP-binding protein, partial [Evtepia gabavorous]
HICAGLLAHVDAGKTTLSEALLYTAGAIPALGRVDHRDAYLDTHALERDRGITIFSKQALFQTPALAVTLLDTPGHVDFSAEMERTLQVLDYAILVISATDGVQAHTETLWRLLRRNQIPTFLFVTKMDLPNPGREAILAGLQRQLDEGCADFTRRDGAWAEGVALRDEGLLDRYLETGRLTPRDVSGLVRLGRLFPCYFGAALRLEGVADFLQGLTDYTEAPVYPPDFAARVFKIARDSQGNRLTYAKLTGAPLPSGPCPTSPKRAGRCWRKRSPSCACTPGPSTRPRRRFPPARCAPCWGSPRPTPARAWGRAPAPPCWSRWSPTAWSSPDCPAQVLLPKLRQLEEEDPSSTWSGTSTARRSTPASWARCRSRSSSA